MGKPGKSRNIRERACWDDDDLDEHSEGLEKPRPKPNRPAEPRPDQRGDPSRRFSTSSFLAGYQAGQYSSYSQGSSTQQYPQTHHNTPACQHSKYDIGSQPSMSGHGYSSQQATSGELYQQTHHGSQGHSSNQDLYPQQMTANSYGQGWLLPTSASSQYGQSASSASPGSPYQPYNQPYDGRYQPNAAIAPTASMCEHRRPDDGSYVGILTTYRYVSKANET